MSATIVMKGGGGDEKGMGILPPSKPYSIRGFSIKGEDFALSFFFFQPTHFICSLWENFLFLPLWRFSLRALGFDGGGIASSHHPQRGGFHAEL